MTIQAALFDFSGTLFRLEDDESWAADLRGPDGRPMTADEAAEVLWRLTTPDQRVADFDERGLYAWEHRDLSADLHREAYMEVLRQAGVVAPQADEVYARMIDPLEWTPYPDTGTVLKSLDTQGIPVAVVSNIAFDIRPSFAAHGWEDDVALYALSYEIGAMKPDPRIFEWTLERLGVAPENALMVGDSRENDGGATALGCAFAWVDPQPTAQRPDGLRTALRAHGIDT
ncbi:HAD superfamily hydrolase (TIGR01493 family) [Nocardia transvalensis]|uniref:HAD superfamily hydrolase (TIGR01493 family) n=1 Tax=Nocardia transvalensis TaxID=37333 RepID=A0A7W9PGX2_9NOCA|nr:HAD-IA family hydrolase [Nocardia transvalensis]MBB5915852.1 HAD superfamily hydrolase (TIGR01493 family) [Nocardia transvalensis]